MGERSADQTLRIIGGKWRGRKVSFVKEKAAQAGKGEIRPTPDRVRETLFNWLTPYVRQSHCLDLFAGSGILSLEALSRGAEKVTIIDQLSGTVHHIEGILKKFEEAEGKYQCIVADSFKWLQTTKATAFDIVFLDPPFQKKNLYPMMQLLNDSKLLKPEGLIYVEAPQPLDLSQLPSGWIVEKEKKAGAVHFFLCQAS